MQDEQQPQEDGTPDQNPAVEPQTGDQGDQVDPNDPANTTPPGEQVPQDAAATSFDPNQPVRTSPPAPEEQSGVPDLPNGDNEGVELPSGDEPEEGAGSEGNVSSDGGAGGSESA
jgi:hypothetical protein